MKEKPGPGMPAWLRLDNAAKIYPAARTRNWMALYRMSVTLKEDVDEALLQRALSLTLRRIPLFAYRLRRGLFWHYFDRQDKGPRVEPDSRNILMPLNLTQNRDFLFRVRYHRKRISLEVFHALADGSGAVSFLMTLAAEYLVLRDGKRIPARAPILDTREKPREAEWEDSFPKYARDVTRPRGEDPAWRLRGTPEPHGLLRVVTGIIPTERLLSVAREHKTTVTSLLAALMLRALMNRKKESRRGRDRPVKLSLPVNLRNVYPSKTLRNFSFYVNVPVRMDYGEYSLDDLIAMVSHYMGIETMEPMLNARFSANVKAERNPLLRAAPLVIKTLALKAVFRVTGERYMTSTLTNMGRIAMPPEMEQHVERMDLVLGRSRKTPLNCAILSACGKTMVTFSITMMETDVERDFFTSLIRLGVPVLIESN